LTRISLSSIQPDETIRIHNQPNMNISADELINNLKQFNGSLIIQTLFLRGKFNGRKIDNTTLRR